MACWPTRPSGPGWARPAPDAARTWPTVVAAADQVVGDLRGAGARRPIVIPLAIRDDPPEAVAGAVRDGTRRVEALRYLAGWACYREIPWIT